MARILVADDDVDIRELVEFKLSTMGHEITAVGDGAAAVEACQANRPDLAVLDVMITCFFFTDFAMNCNTGSLGGKPAGSLLK